MANHKRGKPKNARAGCPMCKPWKINGLTRPARLPFNQFRKLQAAGADEQENQLPERSRQGVNYG